MCALVRGMTDILTPVNLLCYPNLNKGGGQSYVTEPLKNSLSGTVNSGRTLMFTKGWTLETSNNNTQLSNVIITYSGPDSRKVITLKCHVNNTSGANQQIRIRSTTFTANRDTYYTSHISIIENTNINNIRMSMNSVSIIYRSDDHSVTVLRTGDNDNQVAIYGDVTTGESDITLTFSDLALYEGQFVNPLNFKNNIHQIFYSQMANTSQAAGQYTLPNSYANHWLRLAMLSPGTLRFFSSDRHLNLGAIRRYKYTLMNDPISSVSANRQNIYEITLDITVYNSTYLRIYLDAKCVGTSGGIFTKFRLAYDPAYCTDNGAYVPCYLEGWYTPSYGGGVLYVFSTFSSTEPGTFIGDINYKGNHDVIIGSEVVPTSVGENVATIIVPS